MASLSGLLHADHSRLITVTGAGGSGKTRLAVEVGRQQAETGTFPDGVFWVALEHLSSPSERTGDWSAGLEPTDRGIGG